jgi:hypothetical protein
MDPLLKQLIQFTLWFQRSIPILYVEAYIFPLGFPTTILRMSTNIIILVGATCPCHLMLRALESNWLKL